MVIKIFEEGVVRVSDIDQLARLAVIERKTKGDSLVLISEVARLLGSRTKAFIVRLLEDNEDLLVAKQHVFLRNINYLQVRSRSPRVKQAWQNFVDRMGYYFFALRKVQETSDRIADRNHELKEAKRRAYSHYDSDVEKMYAASYDKAFKENMRDYHLLTMYLMYYPEANTVSSRQQAVDAYEDFLEDLDDDDFLEI